MKDEIRKICSIRNPIQIYREVIETLGWEYSCVFRLFNADYNNIKTSFSPNFNSIEKHLLCNLFRTVSGLALWAENFIDGSIHQYAQKTGCDKL